MSYLLSMGHPTADVALYLEGTMTVQLNMKPYATTVLMIR
jgi:hypothetical protein